MFRNHSVAAWKMAIYPAIAAYLLSRAVTAPLRLVRRALGANRLGPAPVFAPGPTPRLSPPKRPVLHIVR